MKIEKFQHENYLKQIECLHCVGKKNWLASLVFLSFNIYNDCCNIISNIEEI